MLQQWILNNTQTSRVYTDFQKHFEDYVNSKYNETKAADIISQMDWETWVKVGGLPPVQLDFTTVALNESKQMASEYIATPGSSPADYEDYKNWTSGLHVVFHEQLITQYDEVTLEILTKIDEDFNVTETLDPEVK